LCSDCFLARTVYKLRAMRRVARKEDEKAHAA
jgi:hypothetical protein